MSAKKIRLGSRADCIRKFGPQSFLEVLSTGTDTRRHEFKMSHLPLAGITNIQRQLMFAAFANARRLWRVSLHPTWDALLKEFLPTAQSYGLSRAQVMALWDEWSKYATDEERK